jgi:hypothetical protein
MIKYLLSRGPDGDFARAYAKQWLREEAQGTWDNVKRLVREDRKAATALAGLSVVGLGAVVGCAGGTTNQDNAPGNANLDIPETFAGQFRHVSPDNFYIVMPSEAQLAHMRYFGEPLNGDFCGCAERLDDYDGDDPYLHYLHGKSVIACVPPGEVSPGEIARLKNRAFDSFEQGYEHSKEDLRNGDKGALESIVDIGLDRGLVAELEGDLELAEQRYRDTIDTVDENSRVTEAGSQEGIGLTYTSLPEYAGIKLRLYTLTAQYLQ